MDHLRIWYSTSTILDDLRHDVQKKFILARGTLHYSIFFFGRKEGKKETKNDKIIYKYLRLKNNNSIEISQMIKSAFVPSADWGPKNSKELASWREFKEMRRKIREKRQCSKLKQFVYIIFCWEDKLWLRFVVLSWFIHVRSRILFDSESCRPRK